MASALNDYSGTNGTVDTPSNSLITRDPRTQRTTQKIDLTAEFYDGISIPVKADNTYFSLPPAPNSTPESVRAANTVISNDVTLFDSNWEPGVSRVLAGNSYYFAYKTQKPHIVRVRSLLDTNYTVIIKCPTDRHFVDIAFSNQGASRSRKETQGQDYLATVDSTGLLCVHECKIRNNKLESKLLIAVCVERDEVGPFSACWDHDREDVLALVSRQRVSIIFLQSVIYQGGEVSKFSVDPSATLTDFVARDLLPENELNAGFIRLPLPPLQNVTSVAVQQRPTALTVAVGFENCKVRIYKAVRGEEKDEFELESELSFTDCVSKVAYWSDALLVVGLQKNKEICFFDAISLSPVQRICFNRTALADADFSMVMTVDSKFILLSEWENSPAYILWLDPTEKGPRLVSVTGFPLKNTILTAVVQTVETKEALDHETQYTERKHLISIFSTSVHKIEGLVFEVVPVDPGQTVINEAEVVDEGAELYIPHEPTRENTNVDLSSLNIDRGFVAAFPFATVSFKVPEAEPTENNIVDEVDRAEADVSVEQAREILVTEGGFAMADLLQWDHRKLLVEARNLPSVASDTPAVYYEQLNQGLVVDAVSFQSVPVDYADSPLSVSEVDEDSWENMATPTPADDKSSLLPVTTLVIPSAYTMSVSSGPATKSSGNSPIVSVSGSRSPFAQIVAPVLLSHSVNDSGPQTQTPSLSPTASVVDGVVPNLVEKNSAGTRNGEDNGTPLKKSPFVSLKPAKVNTLPYPSDGPGPAPAAAASQASADEIVARVNQAMEFQFSLMMPILKAQEKSIANLTAIVNTQNKQLIALKTDLARSETKIIQEIDQRMKIQFNAQNLSNRDAQAKAAKVDGEKVKTLLKTISDTMHQSIEEKTSKIFKQETTQSLVPQLSELISKMLNREQLVSQLSAALTAGFNSLNTNIKANNHKLITGADVTQALSKAVAEGVKQPTHEAFTQAFSTTLLPGVEASCKDMFRQLNDTFDKGTKACAVANRTDTSKLQEQFQQLLAAQQRTLLAEQKSQIEAVKTFITAELNSRDLVLLQRIQSLDIQKAAAPSVEEQIALQVEAKNFSGALEIALSGNDVSRVVQVCQKN